MAEAIADSFFKRPGYITGKEATERTEVQYAQRQGEPEHLVALRAAFPNMWVRADGSIQCQEFGVYWNPGDVEQVTNFMQRNEETGGIETSGLIHFLGVDYGRGRVKLRLSQVAALVNYVKAETDKRNG